MTVLASNPRRATLVEVDEAGVVVASRDGPSLNRDLTLHADVAATGAEVLLGNDGLCYQGVKLVGDGFLLNAEEATALIVSDRRHEKVVRPFLTGRDVTQRSRGLFVIDFAGRQEEEARAFPILYDLVRTRVKPERDANRDAQRRRNWWRFGRSNSALRAAVDGLPRFMITSEVSKHRIFTFAHGEVVPDGSLFCAALSDSWHVGVLSSRMHTAWCEAAAGRLGVGNDFRYNKGCFDPFPFPDPPAPLRAKIAEVAERLDAHRKAAIERDEVVTMTGMYNVVEKLKSGAALTPKERKIHEIAACGVLKDIHDELDRLVAEAYGWEWPLTKEIILERLVALHDERVREEKTGKVRWLRPDYQIPRFGKDLPSAPGLGIPEAAPVAPAAKAKAQWPGTAVEQISAIQAALAAEDLTVEEVSARFKGARVELVRRHVETLALMGEVREGPGGRYRVAVGVAASTAS